MIIKIFPHKAEIFFAIFCSILFTFENWALGPYSFMYGYGSSLETIPAHLAILKNSNLFSSFTPALAGGIDRFAFWGNSDPLNWETFLLLNFPIWLANGLHRFIQYFIAIFFTIQLCKSQLGMSSNQGKLCGVLFACFSYFTFGDMLALPGLPLFLCLIEYVRNSHSKFWIPIGIGLGYSSFTTFLHTDPYLFVFTFLWIILVKQENSLEFYFKICSVFIGLTIGDLPQLIASISNASISHRSNFDPETINFTFDGLLYRQLRFDYFNQDPVTKFFTWVMPLPLLFSGASTILFFRLKNKIFSTFGLLFIKIFFIYFLLSQRWLFILIQNFIGEWIPPIKGIFMGRFFDFPASFLIACQLTLLISMSIQYLSLKKLKLLLAGTYTLTAAFILLMWIEPKLFLFYRNGVDSWGQKNYEISFLNTLKNSNTEPFRVASVLPLQPSYAYAQGLETVDGWANIYPKVYREYWLQILKPLFLNIPESRKIFDPATGKPQDHYIFLGADLIHPYLGALPEESGNQMLVDGFDIDKRFNLKLLGLLNVKYILSEFPLKSNEITLIHAPPHPSHKVYSRDWATGFLSPISKPIASNILQEISNGYLDLLKSIDIKSRGKDIYVYQLNSFVSRFHFAKSIILENSSLGVLNRLSNSNMESLKEHVVLNKDDATFHFQQQKLELGKIISSKLTADKIEIEIESAGDSFLVIGYTWSPYWVASIDGIEQKIIRANYAQLGLPLSKGRHNVVLRFNSFSSKFPK